MPLSDAELSRTLAQRAGELLVDLRASFGDIAPGDTDRANELRKAGDAAAHELLAAALAEHRPHDALLSEEGKDDEGRLTAARVWIVDPLDGTFEFGQLRSDFAVHVALWHSAESRLSACTVDLPAQGLTRSVLDVLAPEVHGEPDATVSAASKPLPTDRAIRLVASRTRPPVDLDAIVARLSHALKEAGVNEYGVEILDVGSVGAKVNELLAGRAEVYVHDTGFYEWDVAAPYGVAQHYGFDASHIDGVAIDFNRMPPYVSNLLVTHPQLTGLMLTAIAEARA